VWLPSYSPVYFIFTLELFELGLSGIRIIVKAYAFANMPTCQALNEASVTAAYVAVRFSVAAAFEMFGAKIPQAKGIHISAVVDSESWT
jgi:hypothetical protein